MTASTNLSPESPDRKPNGDIMVRISSADEGAIDAIANDGEVRIMCSKLGHHIDMSPQAALDLCESLTKAVRAAHGCGDAAPAEPSDEPVASEPRDPHPQWWVEHRQIGADLNTWLYSHPGEPDSTGAYDARVKRMSALEELIFETPIATFEGCDVILDALKLEFEDQGEPLLDEALHQLVAFLSAIRSGLKRHGRLREVELLLWEEVGPFAPCWKDHSGVPANADAIWRAARDRDDGDQGDTCRAKIIGPSEANPALGIMAGDTLILADEAGWSAPGVYLLSDGTFARLEERPEDDVYISRVNAIERPACDEARSWPRRRTTS